MKLWIQWLHAVRGLRPACTRSLTFLWMTLVLMGLCCRSGLRCMTRDQSARTSRCRNLQRFQGVFFQTFFFGIWFSCQPKQL